ncbi:MAG: DEAD/DEAH box helicase [Phycisphaerae bacterium]|nr:DEAD/DEAH box helicase [Phycisphaerae bacterium]
MEITSVLGPEGAVARRLRGYEVRPEQIEMAAAVANAFGSKRHLLVEAGTGVGKSFAYLLPAIEQILSRRTKVLISTFTIALQEQLIEKDIPFLNAVIPEEFTAILVKGRNNYVCLRRLERVSKRQEDLFSEQPDLEELWRIEDWAYRTEDGSLSDLPQQPRPAIWDRVRSEHGNCKGHRCAYHERCFYQRARRRMLHADMLVVNHALLLSDLVLRQDDGAASLLPECPCVVIDEAHTFEEAASAHFGSSISDGQIRFLLNALYHEKTRRGLLTTAGTQDAIKAVKHARAMAKAFFDELGRWQQRHGRENGRIQQPDSVINALSPALLDLQRRLRQACNRAQDEDDRFELHSYMQRVGAVAESVTDLVGQKWTDYVYWLEASAGRNRTTTLKGCPVHVGPHVRETLFDRVDSAVLTSATLCVGPSDSFGFVRQRLGLDSIEPDMLKLGSPFDYRKQVTIHIEAGMPDPAEGTAFLTAVSRRVEKYILETRGRAFVLFTSYRTMDEVATALESFFSSEGIELMVQGHALPRNLMLERFRQNVGSVIFGTDSFWQGVDVPGESLSNVIIVKLPFAVPDRPVIQARLEQIRREGGNPFTDYQLPQAILKFKQGFGRLIRGKQDKGIVVILDPRIVRKHYGRAFLESLPECQVVQHSETP